VEGLKIGTNPNINVIVSKAQTASVSALSKLFFSINLSTSSRKTHSATNVLSGHRVLTVAGNITMNKPAKLPALMGHMFFWRRRNK